MKLLASVMIHFAGKRGLDAYSNLSDLGHLPGKQKMPGLSPTNGHIFLVLSHTIHDTACPFAVYILALTEATIIDLKINANFKGKVHSQCLDCDGDLTSLYFLESLFIKLLTCVFYSNDLTLFH